MTTARERYEAKTKVITFRVALEVYAEIEEARAKGGLSYSDLIKLGAEIATQEIKAKLANHCGLQSKLAELTAAIARKEEELDRFLNEEKERRLRELDTQMAAFKLFDRQWDVGQVSIQLGIPQPAARDYFDDWVKERQGKEAVEMGILRLCLKRHIARLRNRKMMGLFRSNKEFREVVREIDYCQSLLENPSDIGGEWKRFLLSEYADFVGYQRGWVSRAQTS